MLGAVASAVGSLYRQDSVTGYMAMLFSMSFKLQLLHSTAGLEVGATGAIMHLPVGSSQSHTPGNNNKRVYVLPTST